MSEYIKKEDAVNAIYERLFQIGYDQDPLALSIRQFVRELPGEDVVAKRVGEWQDRGSMSCRCSNCGCKSPKEYNYCPNCGAIMNTNILVVDWKNQQF